VTTKDNSLAANRSVKERKEPMRERLLRVIRAAGERGVTVDELERVTALPHQTASPRIHELALMGRIVDAGTRPTRSGRKAAVWVAKETTKDA
jgi:predicted transcriptional regulator